MSREPREEEAKSSAKLPSPHTNNVMVLPVRRQKGIQNADIVCVTDK